MKDPYKQGKDYLKIKEKEAKEFNKKSGLFGEKKDGMDLLREEADKENADFDKKKKAEKNKSELETFLFVLAFIFFVLYWLFK